jgi:hypothetical protein
MVSPPEPLGAKTHHGGRHGLLEASWRQTPETGGVMLHGERPPSLMLTSTTQAASEREQHR